MEESAKGPDRQVAQSWRMMMLVIVLAASSSISRAGIRPPDKQEVVRPKNVSQFWIAPGQPTTLFWQYLPGQGGALRTNLPYTLRDYEGNTLETKFLKIESNGCVSVTASLPTGYYEVEIATQRFGVVSQPPAITNRPDRFFAIDGALSSLGYAQKEPVRAQLIDILARCGIGMVRDRSNWRQNNPTPGEWGLSNRLDSVRWQCQQSRVAVLECFQDAPSWTGAGAVDPYPSDLCATRSAWGQLARRWGGSWGALEVWNEPNLQPFPPDRWSAMLKAIAYGIQEVRPDLPYGGGAFSTYDQPFLEHVARNHALDVMGFVSLHSYAPAPGMEALIKQYRSWLASAGHETMPLWLTECGRPWSRGPARPPIDQAQASALDTLMQVIEARACGVERVFPFIYGYYDEKQNNFGMLGRENTPLRSMAAYANLIRIMSRRTYAGDLAGVEGVLRSRVFADEESQTALIVLYTGAPKPGASVTLDLPVTRIEGMDGRLLKAGTNRRIPISDGLTYVWVSGSAIGSRLRTDTEAARLYRVSRQPKPAPRPVSPLVLRFMADPHRTRTSAGGYEVSDPYTGSYPACIRVFNLGSNDCRALVSGTILTSAQPSEPLHQEEVNIPAGGVVELAWTLDLNSSRLAADGRIDLAFDAVDIRTGTAMAGGGGGHMAIRLTRPVGIDVLLAHRTVRLDTPVREVQRWQVNVAPEGTMAFSSLAEGGVHIEAHFAPTVRDAWAYPQFFGIPPAESMREVKGLVIRGRVEGGEIVRLFASEKSGAKYIRATPAFPADGQWHNVFVSLQDFTPFGQTIDPNGRLDPDQIEHIEIGCNTSTRHSVIEVNQLWFVGEETPWEKTGNK